MHTFFIQLRAVAHLSLHLISIDNHKYISDGHGLAPDEMKSASDSFACSFRTCCSVFQRTVCAHLHLHSSIRSYFEPAYTTLHYTHAHTPSMRIIIGISIESNIRATAAAVLYLHTFISNFQSGVCAHGLLKTVSAAAAFYKFIHFVNKKKAIHDARAKGKKNKIVLN